MVIFVNWKWKNLDILEKKKLRIFRVLVSAEGNELKNPEKYFFNPLKGIDYLWVFFFIIEPWTLKFGLFGMSM